MKTTREEYTAECACACEHDGQFSATTTPRPPYGRALGANVPRASEPPMMRLSLPPPTTPPPPNRQKLLHHQRGCVWAFL
jgi:hypothetical protein